MAGLNTTLCKAVLSYRVVVVLCPTRAPRPESGRHSGQFERPPGAKTEHGRLKRQADVRKAWL